MPPSEDMAVTHTPPRPDGSAASVTVPVIVPPSTSTASTSAVVAPAETVTGLTVVWGASGELVEPPHVGSNSTV